MTIRHLKIFIAVAQYNSMSKAAKALFISQPSISQAIKEVEDYYGVQLFERLSKKLYITPSGELLLNYARHLIDSYDEMEISMHGSGQKSILHIGATITAGTCLLPSIIERFEQQNQVQTRVVVNNTSIIETMLLQSELDVGLIEGTQTHADLIRQPVFEDELVLVVGKNHPFYGRQTIRLEECQGQRFLVREVGSGVRDHVAQHLEAAGIVMEMAWECTNTETLKEAAKKGFGIAVFSDLMVQPELQEKTLHRIRVENMMFSRQICLVFHKNKFMSEPLLAFLSSCNAFSKELEHKVK
ncbi:MAG: LysR family transcriptional regulator [Erysipelotrichaceae bacterium]